METDFYNKNKSKIDEFLKNKSSNYYIEGIIDEEADVYEGIKLSIKILNILPNNFKDKEVYMINLSEINIPDKRFVAKGHKTIIFGESLEDNIDDILAKKFVNLSVNYEFPSNNK